MRILRLTSNLQKTFGDKVAELEQIATYPLGEDSFKIDHGQDYFAFFKRLGHLEYYAATTTDSVVGVGAGVLRTIPTQSGKNRNAWYLCDLKVRPDFRGKRIPLKLLTRAFPLNYLRCRRGYAISMNPAGRENRVVGLLQHFKWARLTYAGKLLFYSLDAMASHKLRPMIEQYRGPISFLSLQDCKRLVMQSDGQPLKLLHIQHGMAAQNGLNQPVDGFVHMICSPETDPLATAFANCGIEPSATASLIQHGLDRQDWSFVLTSDI